MTQVTKIEAALKRYPFLERYIYKQYRAPESNHELHFKPFTTEVFFSRQIFGSPKDDFSNIWYNLVDINGKEVFQLNECKNTDYNVEKAILAVQKSGEKVAYLVQQKSMGGNHHNEGLCTTLYIPPEGCDSIVEIMIPMLEKEREVAEEKLRNQIRGLYSKKQDNMSGNE
jgi:hypothetical protein